MSCAKMSAVVQADKKGHVCPPSNANHPSDRWETSFVYAFMCKFTQLRSKVEGLETPMDFENSLLSREPNPILSSILQQFILNLRPQTRTLSSDEVSSTVANILADYLKTSERTVFWDDALKVNLDPFEGLRGGFFAAEWGFKLKILRQLVELQLTHAPEIKGIIDHAWGVIQHKAKKKDDGSGPSDANIITSRESLQLIPLGQDIQRKRYWIADDSPRIYISTNPWKITATFQAVSSTRDEYIATIEMLKASAPPELKNGEKKTKLELAHLALINHLESRIKKIDVELTRVQKVRRKLEQKNLLLVQAELRQTRTRRQTRRPDYVYSNAADSDDNADDYKYQEDDDYDEDRSEQDHYLDFPNDHPSGRRSSRTTTGRRRSSRATAAKRTTPEHDWGLWRGERRSTRLGTQLPLKRARTEESNTSANSLNGDHPASITSATADQPKTNGAAAVRPTEIAMEQVAGRKRSKFWFYAVEPIAGCSSGVNGQQHNGNAEISRTCSTISNSVQGNDIVMDFRRSLEGSLSPTSSIES